MTKLKNASTPATDNESNIPSREAYELGLYYQRRAADPNASEPKATPALKALAIELMRNFIAGQRGADELHVVCLLLDALLMANVKADNKRKADAMLAASGLGGLTVDLGKEELLRSIDHESIAYQAFSGMTPQSAERQAALDALPADPDPDKVKALLLALKRRRK